MATTAVLIRAAIEAAIKGITPSVRADVKFALLDGDDAPADMAIPSGVLRRFQVAYGPGREGPYQAGTDAETIKDFLIAVVYPVEGNFMRVLDDLIESDIHKIRATLNDYLVWALTLADSTALLHAFIEEWEPRTERLGDRLVLVLPLQVQFLESVS